MNDIITIDTLLKAHLEEKADQPCLIYKDEAITYSQFNGLVNHCAVWLKDQGVRAGDRIALWLTNQPEWLGLLFGAARIGAGVVTINTRYRGSEVQHILAESGTRMLVMQRQFRRIDFVSVLDTIDADALTDLKAIALIGVDDDAPDTLMGRPVIQFQSSLHSSVELPYHTDDSSPFVYFATSGTTKAPKLVQHSQRTAAWHSTNAASAYGYDQPDAVTLAAVPLCGVYGFDTAMASFTGGAPIVLMETFEPNEAFELIQRYNVTHLAGTDDLYRQLLQVVPTSYTFPSARLYAVAFYTAGWRTQAEAYWARHLPLRGIYGSSETHAIFSIQPDALPLQQIVEAGGMPAAKGLSQIRIRHEETGEILPNGTSGDLEIKSPGNFVGYFNDPEATRGALTEDGFFRTGDIGYLRDDGTFVYQSRKGDMIRLSGFLVNPTEIEDEIKAIENIANAQVIAVEIEGRLKSAAFVICDDLSKFDSDAITAQLKAKVAPFKIPARIWCLEEFPVALSPNGIKVQRAKLREMAVANLAADTTVSGGE